MIGKYNKLTVLKDLGLIESKSGRRVRRVLAKCECGIIKSMIWQEVKNGRTKSCGCFVRKIFATHGISHGLTGHQLHKLWLGMKGRCNDNNPKNIKYRELNIQVCEAWKHDFMKFFNWAQANGFKKGLQIDRINPLGGYSPGNCRFISLRENMNNKTNTIKLKLNGIEKPLSYWAEEKNIGIETLRRRIFKYNWSIDKAIMTPVRNYKQLI